MIILLGVIFFNFLSTLVFPDKQVEASSKKTTNLNKKTITVPKQFSTNEVRQLLKNQKFLNSEKKTFTVMLKNQTCTITTSLNIGLQKLLNKKLDRLKKLDRGKPERIAMVAMDPVSGKVLALTGFDLIKPDRNPCFASDFPAASIFKIITASAAVEELGFTPDTKLYFNGSKYTLYKSQLKETKTKYTTTISFENAFAESVNPVFGKIGRNRLKNKILEKYANKFEFNKQIDSELAFGSSNIEVTENPYAWAEIGCGFNHSTTISPLFGAMISSTIANAGKLVIPSIVEKIVDSQNKIIYDSKDEIYSWVVSEKTAAIVQTLMEKTIESGTARKNFRGYKQDKILSKLVIGGKTGSIYNREHTIKYDWFTGFVKQKDVTVENNEVVVSIVVGHGDYIGTRAGEYGKMIIKEYYKNI